MILRLCVMFIPVLAWSLGYWRVWHPFRLKCYVFYKHIHSQIHFSDLLHVTIWLVLDDASVVVLVWLCNTIGPITHLSTHNQAVFRVKSKLPFNYLIFMSVYYYMSQFHLCVYKLLSFVNFMFSMFKLTCLLIRFRSKLIKVNFDHKLKKSNFLYLCFWIKCLIFLCFYY